MTKPRIRSPYGGTAEQKLSFYSDPQPDGCIFWTGHRDDCGYGVIWYKGRFWKANRLALTIKLGRAIKPKLYSLHTCHRPYCINPDHLYEGTQLDNMRDMHEAGRDWTTRGDIHHKAKFTEAQIEAIAKDPRKYRFIYREYGVSRTHYRRIKKRTARV